jgi:hypothetical protein
VHFPVGEALAAVGARERDAQIDLGGPGYL